MRNAGIKRAGAQLTRILQGLFRRQRQEVDEPHHAKGDEHGQPVNLAKERGNLDGSRCHRHGGGGFGSGGRGGGHWFCGLILRLGRFLIFHFRA